MKVNRIPNLIPRQHESESGLTPRLSSPACEVGMSPDRFSSLVHRIQAHAFKYIVTILTPKNLFSLAAMELPQINYRAYNGRKYSFVYGMSGDFLLNSSVRFSPANK